jgi:hypothetical protein
MSELATPVAKRLERPSWRDSRLVVGVILVLVAATLGSRLVASADDRLPYFVAAADLVAGEQVAADSFRRVDVALADVMGGAYVTAGAPAPEGRVLLRDLRAGELVPASALGTAGDLDLQPVTVRADSVSTTGLAGGQRVDLYVTPKEAIDGRSSDRSSGTDGRRTTRLLEAVAVLEVRTSDGGFGSAATTSVQLFVPSDQVLDVIEAVDSEAKLTLVPVVGTGAEPGPA